MTLDYICSFLLSEISENLKFDIIKNMVSKRNSLLTESLEEGDSVMETLIRRALESTLYEDEENARDSFNKSIKALRLTNDYLNRKTARENISKKASKEARSFNVPKYDMDRIKGNIKSSKKAIKKMGGIREVSKEAAKAMQKGPLYSKDISLEQGDALLSTLRRAARDTMRRAGMKKHVNENIVEDILVGKILETLLEGTDKSKEILDKQVKALKLYNDFLNRSSVKNAVKSTNTLSNSKVSKDQFSKIKDSIQKSKKDFKDFGGKKEVVKAICKNIPNPESIDSKEYKKLDAVIAKGTKDGERRKALEKRMNEEEVVIKKEEKPKDDLSFGAWAKKSLNSIDQLHKESKENK